MTKFADVPSHQEIWERVEEDCWELRDIKTEDQVSPTQFQSQAQATANVKMAEREHIPRDWRQFNKEA